MDLLDLDAIFGDAPVVPAARWWWPRGRRRKAKAAPPPPEAWPPPGLRWDPDHPEAPCSAATRGEG